MSGAPVCCCGCKRLADYLVTGTDDRGHPFTDEPMCESAYIYSMECSADLHVKIHARKIEMTANG